MSQKSTTAPARDYEVGYGKPPMHTRFKKGQSGNPSGRPKKQDRAPILEEAKELALKEAYRKLTIREGGKVRRIPAIQAVYRAQIAAAVKGNGPAARAVIEMIQGVESEYERRSEAQVDSWMEYKIDAQRRIADCQRRGLPIDDIKPHPDDIMVDVNAGRVWFAGDIWPDDAAKVRELGLLGRPTVEPPPAANDDDAELCVPAVVLANVLDHLDFEAEDALVHAYNLAQEARRASSEPAGSVEPGLVRPPKEEPTENSSTQAKTSRPRGPVLLPEILKRLEPEYHDVVRQALAVERSELARLLAGAPHPRPSYAGMPAELAAGLVRMYSGERLRALSQDANSPILSERLKDRAASILQKRLADLSRLKDDPHLPKAMRVEVENALRKFNE